MLQKLTDYVLSAPENRVQADYALSPELVGLPLYDAPLLAVGDAADPLFEQLKARSAVGEWFCTPEQWLPGAKRVISLFLPFSQEVKCSNYDGADPSPMWLHSRIEGQSFLTQVIQFLCAELEKEGYAAVVPATHPMFRAVENASEPGGPAFTSSWSERHVAFVCGMGTFGLNRGLITEKGMAGRFASLVTTAELPVTPRAYTDLYEYCTQCGACIRRCPAAAITREGKSHEPCAEFIRDTKQRFAPRYGCGKCQVKVPCMDKIPGRE